MDVIVVAMQAAGALCHPTSTRPALHSGLLLGASLPSRPVQGDIVYTSPSSCLPPLPVLPPLRPAFRPVQGDIVFTDYYGPLGGGRELSNYYGRRCGQGGRGAHVQHWRGASAGFAL